MMQDHFLQYLDRVSTPERKLAFQGAYQTLAQLGITDHVFWIDQMMEQDDLGDASDLLLEVENMLNGAMHALLIQFGVHVDVECSMSTSTDILKGLLAMDNWSEPAVLQAAAEMDETPEVALAVLLAITGTQHEADYLPHLSQVSLNLINRIAEVNKTPVDSALPSREEHERAQKRLDQFFTAYNAPILSQAISEMLLIGGNYKAIMASYEKTVSDLPMEKAVDELVGFALASSLDNGDGLREAILEECQGWWDGNPSNATKLSALVTERLKKANAQ